MIISDIEILRENKKPRNLEAEIMFLAGMEDLAEIKFRNAVLVWDGDTILIGLYMIFHGEPENDR